MKSLHSFPKATRSRGMSLIETLVGLAIALIAMLIVFQVFSASGERTRTTTSGSDAQVAGTLAMYQLERDIKMAGMGFGQLPPPQPPATPRPWAGSVFGCTVHAYNSTLATPDFTFPLLPVQIIPNATTGAPVQIAVTYGDSAYSVLPRHFNTSTNTTKTLDSRDAFQLGDIVLVISSDTSAAAGKCALIELTGYPPSDAYSVVHAQGAGYTSVYTGATTATMNAAAGANTLVANTGYAYNLGPTPHRNLWQVTPAGAASPNMLVWTDTLHTNTQSQVTEGVVNLQAEYGVDNGNGGAPAVAGDGIISPSEWTTTAPADATPLLAVRFAVLARSQQYEKPPIVNGACTATTVAPFWANDPAGHSFTMFNVDGTTDNSPGNANDWRCYRYRVYESTVPLRNTIWGN